MNDYRIGVTVSRTWTDLAVMSYQLGIACQEARMAGRRPVVVHGDSPRGDRAADTIARAHGIKTEPHPAAWKELGTSAGFIRNAEMVRAGADVWLAFICPCLCTLLPQPHDTHGATHCADLAKRAGIEVRRFRPVTA